METRQSTATKIGDTSRDNVNDENLKTGDNLTSAAVIIINGDEQQDVKNSNNQENDLNNAVDTQNEQNKGVEVLNESDLLEDDVNIHEVCDAGESDIDEGPFEVVDDAEINDDEEDNVEIVHVDSDSKSTNLNDASNKEMEIATDDNIPGTRKRKTSGVSQPANKRPKPTIKLTLRSKSSKTQQDDLNAEKAKEKQKISKKNDHHKDGEISKRNDHYKDGGEISKKTDHHKDGETSKRNDHHKDGETSKRSDHHKDGETSKRSDHHKDGETSKSKSRERDRSPSKERKRSKDLAKEQDRDKDKRKKDAAKVKEEIKKDETKTKEDAKKELEKAKQEKHRLVLEKFWKTVNEDPTDFSGWTYLLQYVDQENDVESAKEVFDKFLALYPYCYGYWRKYCDLLKKNNLQDECKQAFEKGVTAVPLSVDLWLHYINYFKSICTEDELRDLYNKSIEKCGREYKSDRLWESYIKWETDLNNLSNVTRIFDQWLSTPTLLSVGKQFQQGMSVIARFKEFVKKHSPRDILSTEEFVAVRDEAIEELRERKSNGIGLESLGDAPPGEDSADVLNFDDEIVKNRIISSREEINQKTRTYFSTRAVFEDGIKRPYFHVKPLEASQLSNWADYLNHEIKEQDQERVIFLFERCLIACAMYRCFWLKYVRYLKSTDVEAEKIRSVFVRACTIHHQGEIKIAREWVLFEEKQGNFDKAAEILDNCMKKSPRSLLLRYDRINVEKRRGDLKRAEELFNTYLTDQSLGKEIIGILAVKYAEFCTKILRDVPKAVAFLKKTIENNKSNVRLCMKLIEICRQASEAVMNEVMKFLDDTLPLDDFPEYWKLIYSQRKLELLMEYSDQCRVAYNVFKEHSELARKIKEIRKHGENTKNETGDISKSQDVSVVLDDIPVPPENTANHTASEMQSRQQAVNAPQYGNTAQHLLPNPSYGNYSYSQQHQSSTTAPVQGSYSNYSAAPAYQNAYAYSDPNYNYAAAYYGGNWQAGSANPYGQYNTSWPPPQSSSNAANHGSYQSSYPYYK